MLQQTPGPKRHGRKELVQWLNATLALELQAVEGTRNGAVACLLLDRARPGSIDLSKVDWAADAHALVLRNYKLLQAGLARARVDRPGDVDGLARGTHRACLEFMQWFKAFCERHQVSGMCVCVCVCVCLRVRVCAHSNLPQC